MECYSSMHMIRPVNIFYNMSESPNIYAELRKSAKRERERKMGKVEGGYAEKRETSCVIPNLQSAKN